MNEGFKMNEIEIKQKVVELVDFYNGKFGTNFPYPKVSFYECYKTMGMYYVREDEVAFYRLAGGSGNTKFVLPAIVDWLTVQEIRKLLYPV
jgi:predicted SprT family Zn-dependent metalloprotease